jgi:hypothetical protein
MVEGRGGAEDGIGGIAMALAVLFLAAIFLNRLFHSRITAGFDGDGIYSPSAGWVPWSSVRQIEVRRVGNVVTGRRAVIWVAYQPGADDLLEAAFSGDDDFERATAGEQPADPAGVEPDPAGVEPDTADERPDPAAGDPALDGLRWLRISPSLNEGRTVELSEALERQWAAAGAPPATPGSPATPPPATSATPGPPATPEPPAASATPPATVAPAASPAPAPIPPQAPLPGSRTPPPGAPPAS